MTPVSDDQKAPTSSSNAARTGRLLRDESTRARFYAIDKAGHQGSSAWRHGMNLLLNWVFRFG